MGTPNNLAPKGQIVQGFISASNSPAPLQLDANGNLLTALAADSLTISATITFPATQGVTVQNWPATMGVSASATLPASIQNWPLTTNVSASSALSVTGSVAITPNTAGSPLFITGSVGNTNIYQGLPSPLVPMSAPSTMQDDIAWTVSLTGSLSASNGQVLPLKSDFQGNLASREQYAPLAEDNFNGVYAVAVLPNTASLY